MKNYVYAGFRDRFVMGLLDLIIVLGLIYVIKTPLHVNFFSIYSKELSQFYTVWFIRAIPFLYYIGNWKLLGGTPANIVRQVRILDCATGEKPSLVKLFIRFTGMFVSAPLLFFGYFRMLWDSRKQTWHDKLAGTVAVRNKTHKKAEISVDDIDSITTETGLQFPIGPSERDASIWKVGRFVTGISAVLFVMFCIYWFRDEPLSPGAKQWLSEIDLDERDMQNELLYQLVGFGAPESILPIEYTRDLIKRSDDLIYRIEYNRAAGTNHDFVGEYIKSKFLLSNDIDKWGLHFDDHKKLFDYCAANEEHILNLKEKYKFLDSRYKKISDMSDSASFRNLFLQHYASYTPLCMDYLNYQYLRNHVNAIDYLKGHKTEFLNRINDDIELQKTLLAKSPTLMFRITLTIALLKQLKMYDLLLEQDKQATEVHEAIQSIPFLSKVMLNMEKPFKDEFYTQVVSISTPLSHSNYMFSKKIRITEAELEDSYNLYSRPNENVNHLYEVFSKLTVMSKMDGKELFDTVESYRKPKLNPIKLLRNPTYLLTEMQEQLYMKYSVGSHDINGYITLLKLKSQVYNMKIPRSKIDAFLEENKEKLHNPFSNEAIQFNAETNEIYYTGPYKEEQKNYRSVMLTF